jgi:hypothetical protein
VLVVVCVHTVSLYMHTADPATVPAAIALNDAVAHDVDLSKQSAAVVVSKMQHVSISDARTKTETRIAETTPQKVDDTDSDSDGGTSVYSDDSCDDNDMMTNVEQVTGFYSRATNRLKQRIMHRIKRNAAVSQTLESPRMRELDAVLEQASELSTAMKSKQYKLIVIGEGYGTDVTNTLCGGMKVSTIVYTYFSVCISAGVVACAQLKNHTLCYMQ